jgi:hypothetical protein
MAFFAAAIGNLLSCGFGFSGYGAGGRYEAYHARPARGELELFRLAPKNNGAAYPFSGRAAPVWRMVGPA